MVLAITGLFFVKIQYQMRYLYVVKFNPCTVSVVRRQGRIHYQRRNTQKSAAALAIHRTVRRRSVDPDETGLYLVEFSKPSSRQPHPSLSEMRNASCILPSLSPKKSVNSISPCSKKPDGLSVPQESGQRFSSFHTVLQAADLS